MDTKDIENITMAPARPSSEAAGEMRKLAVPTEQGDEYGNNNHGNAAQGSLKRVFKTRHVQMIALGANIGSGVYVSSGEALRNGSAPGMLIGYGLICSMAMCMLSVLSEAQCLFPTSGSFIDHASRFVDPALGFAIGFCEWFGALTVVAAEGSVVPIVISYWTTSVPTAVWYTIYLAIVVGQHLLPNRVFAEFEFGTGALKVAVTFVVLFTMLVICCGYGGDAIDRGYNYTGLSAFPHGFKGVASVFLLASWATGGQEIIGISSGESAFPRWELPRASKNLVIRIVLIYMSACVYITVLVPYTDPSLLDTSNEIAKSPFIIVLDRVRIRVLPDIVNAVLLVGLAGIGSESMFTASRIQTAMARMGMFPAIFGRVDRYGRPIYSTVCCAVVSIVMTYINLSTGGATAFTWFSSVSATTTFFAWLTIPLTNWCMHRALAAQGDPALQMQHAFKLSWWPLAPLYLAITTAFTLACTIYVSASPIRDSPSATIFFENMLCMPLFITAYVGYKIYFRTSVQDPKTADLHSGRRLMTEEELQMLDNYYAQPMYKRLLSYVNF
ncbi:general amino acid permease [Grosmannia clavigera kw1407]|uniref:General amino acid permease n=1 Tax=Grosmannia clavigera (strain kw1407 / UAMH 11150) TaxID=655863 RepID=F0XUJ6_GROCL|nr:general amino acid permease [Grosmannia clavigera kw1407]EFW99008.1 general amino acid permease [Grosmannia clavigera kw1407]